MAETGEMFLTLPGGAGTLEEIVEQWTCHLSTHLFLSGDPDQTIYDVDGSGLHIVDSLSPRVHMLQ